MTGLRSLLAPILGRKASPPEPFGFKTGWIAVRSTDPKVVAESLPVTSPAQASWRDGIKAAYAGEGAVFITPPVVGWVCIVGEWALGTGEPQSVETIARIVAGLSSRFGEAHGYGTHRIIEYHHWMLARQGQLVRCYAYVGESGECLCQSGTVTDAEKQLPYADLPCDQWLPDEQDVMAVAAGWSINPSKLSAEWGPAAAGILAQLK